MAKDKEESGTATATLDTNDATDKRGDKPRRRDTQPSGQTTAGSQILGETGDDFDRPVTRTDGLGVAEPTRVKKEGKSSSGEIPELFTKLTKALGLKSSDILSYNERTRVIVYSNGAKYQVSRNGKSLRHHQGPQPPSNLNLDVEDARHRSPLTGTAAVINAPSTVTETDPNSLRDERSALRARIKEINAELKGDEDEE